LFGGKAFPSPAFFAWRDCDKSPCKGHPGGTIFIGKGGSILKQGNVSMTNVVTHAAKRTEEKAAAARQDLEQAWAYYMPTPLPQPVEEQPTLGYAPYYEAA
jgi:hypothetical protein